MTAMTEQQQQEFLASIGLGQQPVVAAELPPAAPAKGKAPVLAPEGVDPRTMPVADIEFDPALLDGFPNLDKDGKNAAQNHLFGLYKSPTRNPDRNRRLWDECRLFINQVALSRRSGGLAKPVAEKVKATKEERDLASLIAQAGITVEDLAALIHARNQEA